jgi:hypothetical protein
MKGGYNVNCQHNLPFNENMVMVLDKLLMVALHFTDV